MGLFEKIFGRKGRLLQSQAGKGTVFHTITAYQPAFTSWGGMLYEDALIRSTVDAISRHVSKLRVEFHGSAKGELKAATKSGPNAWQTWPTMLKRLCTIYFIHNNACIVPVLDEFGRTMGFFPVLPVNCDLIEDAGQTFFRYTFSNGKKAAIEFERCAILPRHQLKDDFFGESNHALDSTLDLMDMEKQGVKEGIKNSATFRFIARLTNFSKTEDLAKARKEFNKSNFQDEANGVLLFPSTTDNIAQVDSKPYTINPEEEALIQNNVFNYFGVNEKVLQNTAIGDDLDAFFEGCIEPFAVMLADALTRMTYTQTEIGFGNHVVVTANRLQYMSTGNKIAFARDLGDRGILKIDEIRELFNYDPLPDGAGQHTPIRGEYYFGDEGKEGSKNAKDADGNQNV